MWGEMGSMGWGYGWNFFGMVHMLLWWVLIILGIVVLAKWIFGGSKSGDRETGGRALEVLKERYARGEIDREEFDQKKRDIGG